MNGNSDEIKKEFEKQFNEVQNKNNKEKNFKANLLTVAFILIFVFVLSGTIISYKNYEKAKNNLNSNVNVVQKVVVKEY
jgi:cell division protein FtsX